MKDRDAGRRGARSELQMERGANPVSFGAFFKIRPPPQVSNYLFSYFKVHH